jgi:hypothetical protein
MTRVLPLPRIWDDAGEHLRHQWRRCFGVTMSDHRNDTTKIIAKPPCRCDEHPCVTRNHGAYSIMTCCACGNSIEIKNNDPQPEQEQRDDGAWFAYGAVVFAGIAILFLGCVTLLAVLRAIR